MGRCRKTTWNCINPNVSTCKSAMTTISSTSSDVYMMNMSRPMCACGIVNVTNNRGTYVMKRNELNANWDNICSYII